jgi:hypothetical protein
LLFEKKKTKWGGTRVHLRFSSKANILNGIVPSWTILGIVKNDIVDRYSGKVIINDNLIINGARLSDLMFNFNGKIPKPCLSKLQIWLWILPREKETCY